MTTKHVIVVVLSSLVVACGGKGGPDSTMPTSGDGHHDAASGDPGISACISTCEDRECIARCDEVCAEIHEDEGDIQACHDTVKSVLHRVDTDECPEEEEDVDGFEDEDGCPDYDNDSDDILDVVDTCRDAAEVYNGIDDSDGCPD